MSPATATKKKPAAEPKIDREAGAGAEVLELFPDLADAKVGTKQEIVFLSADEIEPDPDNRPYEPDPELEGSIKNVGILSPVTVVPNPDPERVKAGKPYRLRDGHRRYHAAVAVGRRAIRAIIAVEDAGDSRGHKLLKQWQANWHRKLDPMFEAKLIKDVQKETGLSVAQLAKISGKPKSTIADRLALADAPPAFQPLFEQGTLTAAAAPVVRKFAHVPPRILEQVVERAIEDWHWEYIDHQKPVPVKTLEHDLDRFLSYNDVQEVPENLALLFQGETFDVGAKKMTTDMKALAAAQDKHNKEKDAAAKKAGIKKGEKPTPEKEDRYTREYRLRQERWNREAAARRAEAARFNKASPKIFAAIAEALKKAPTGISANGKSIVAELVLKACGGQGGTKEVLKLMPVGSNAEAILRHAAFLQVVDFAAQGYQRDRVFGIGKRLGVDVKTIIDEAVPKKQPAAKGKKAKGKK